MSSHLATVGILSIGQMGLGIAKLLLAHNFRVLTNVSDRSPATQKRATDANINLVNTDKELVEQADYILSIVPPRDASATATRILTACESFEQSNSNTNPNKRASSFPLYYLDLNAISPSTARHIARLFQGVHEIVSGFPEVRFVDGGIIGGPPTQPSTDLGDWKRPGIPLSGPHPLDQAPVAGERLADLLNTRWVGDSVGKASGLKCCFASLSKGFTALAVQSFGTAQSLGVLSHLQDYMNDLNPSGAARAAKGIEGCPSKAYRWVDEMKEIGTCFAEEGGWKEQARVFREIADVYDGLAEVVDSRGGTEGMRSAEEIVGAVREGLDGKQKKESEV